jgi:SAM-dependent methyltransferase
MQEHEFDKFADEYRTMHRQNISASGEGPEFFAEYKVRDLAGLIGKPHPLPLRILDFGAGIGTSVPWFRIYLPDAELTCLDVSRKSLGLGESRYPEQARFVHFDGHAIPFPDRSFEVAFAACVFHHIPCAEQPGLLAELHRVLAPGGCLVVFEHNPFNPLTVRAVNTCPFDENAVLLRCSALTKLLAGAGFVARTHRYRIFFPAFARALRPLEAYLGWLPLGAQYYVSGIRRATT